jgi:hypothetical protein
MQGAAFRMLAAVAIFLFGLATAQGQRPSST